MSDSVDRIVKRLVDVRSQELAALVWSCICFFLVLAAYFVIPPIRGQTGIAGAVQNLAWLFTGTLVGMLLLHPVFTWPWGDIRDVSSLPGSTASSSSTSSSSTPSSSSPRL